MQVDTEYLGRADLFIKRIAIFIWSVSLPRHLGYVYISIFVSKTSVGQGYEKNTPDQ